MYTIFSSKFYVFSILTLNTYNYLYNKKSKPLNIYDKILAFE